MMLRAGVVPHLLPLMLRFDVTRDESSHEAAATGCAALDMPLFGNADDAQRGAELLRLGSERPNASEARNHQAVQAARALARVAGLLGGHAATPANPEAAETLKTLLTDTLAHRLADPDPRGVGPPLQTLPTRQQSAACCLAL